MDPGCRSSGPCALNQVDVLFWEEMRWQTYACQLCLEGYKESKRVVLEYMENRAQTPEEMEAVQQAREYLTHLDRSFLLDRLHESQKVLDQMAAALALSGAQDAQPDWTFDFALYEVSKPLLVFNVFRCSCACSRHV